MKASVFFSVVAILGFLFLGCYQQPKMPNEMPEGEATLSVKLDHFYSGFRILNQEKTKVLASYSVRDYGVRLQYDENYSIRVKMPPGRYVIDYYKVEGYRAPNAVEIDIKDEAHFSAIYAREADRALIGLFINHPEGGITFVFPNGERKEIAARHCSSPNVQGYYQCYVNKPRKRPSLVKIWQVRGYKASEKEVDFDGLGSIFQTLEYSKN